MSSQPLKQDQSSRRRGGSVLLTVSGTLPANLQQQIDDGMRPRADFLEIANKTDADILDYAAARATTGRLGSAMELLGGPNLVLAYACWKLRAVYRAVVTDGEQVGLPLALLLKLTWGARPRHLMIVHLISVPKKMFFLDWIRLQTHIDKFLVYSSWQQQFIIRRWGLAKDRVLLTPFMVDAEFFAPDRAPPQPTQRPQICAVGLERRDYPTLLLAVQGLDVQVVIAAASPWSKYKDSTSGQPVPDNVTVQKLSQYQLRQLYADSRFLVMPLEPVEFQAGVTAILEAMAMAKPVLCSKVPGQTDVIVEGENGRYVTAGDPSALRAAILRMLAEPQETAGLGMNGRQHIEGEMSLEHYANRLALIVRTTISDNKDGLSPA